MHKFIQIGAAMLAVAALGTTPMDTRCHAQDPGDDILVVMPNTPGGDDGDEWDTAFDDLQDAIALAADPQSGITQIWVAAGTYTPHANDREVSFALQEGVSIYGGFSGGETSLSQRNPNPASNGTILSGDLDNDDQLWTPGTNPSLLIDNSYHVVTATDIDEEDLEFIHLDGFTIRDGQADGSTEPLQRGAGVFCVSNGNVRINNCLITDNHAVDDEDWDSTSRARKTAVNSARQRRSTHQVQVRRERGWGVGGAHGGVAWRAAVTRCVRSV